jgi:hypothetical protein
VVTPWFIDIVPTDLRETLALIHRLLAPGGRWVNYGPLSYHAEQAHVLRYTHEELYELVDLAGFERGPTRTTRIDFMQSRAAARGKVIDVLNFAARKRPDGPAVQAPPGGPPAWLMLPHLPIPRFAGLDGYRPEHPMLKYVVGLIDGKRTLADVAKKMIDEHGARPEAALAGTRAMLSIALGEVNQASQG